MRALLLFSHVKSTLSAKYPFETDKFFGFESVRAVVKVLESPVLIVIGTASVDV